MKRIRDQRGSSRGGLVSSIGLSAALLALVVSTACGKVSSGVGGESHFSCERDTDCPVSGQACVDRKCSIGKPLTSGVGGNVSSFPDASFIPSVAGNANSFPDASSTLNAGGSVSFSPDASLLLSAGGAVAILMDGASNQACVGACCPADATCYSTPAGNGSPGSECQATHDNTGQDHVQLRRAWVRDTAPIGNTSAVVYGFLAGRSELPMLACNQGQNRASFGAGGYLQLIDYYLGGSRAIPADPTRDYATIGFSTYISLDTLAAKLADGFCFGAETYHPDLRYALTTAQITNQGNPFPKGLPSPMGGGDPGGWSVAPTKATRLARDFDLSTDRANLLAELAADGVYGRKGFTGVFFYDATTGVAHGYTPLSFRVLYDPDGYTHIDIPIREVETRSTFNDPQKPNCVGVYRGNALPPETCKSPGPDSPAWGCQNDVQCPVGTGPATTNGYFLITELEQIYSPDLAATLCVTSAGVDTSTSKPIVAAGGFLSADTTSCVGPNWDPTKADDSGLPMGDWCAATNSRATAGCHDAWRSISSQVFTGAKIQGVPDSSAAAPTTCAF